MTVGPEHVSGTVQAAAAGDAGDVVVVVLAVWHCFDSQPAAVPSQAAY